MNDKEFNKLAAEFMWNLVDVGFIGDRLVGETNDGADVSGFNPATDANDRNKVLEKMQVITLIEHDIEGISEIVWKCGTPLLFGYDILATNTSMEAAQNACIQAVLIQWRENNE